MAGGSREAGNSRTIDMPQGNGITCLIRRVGPRFPSAQEYTPQHVSIGLYHMDVRLPGNEEKRTILNNILAEKARTGDGPRDTSELESEWLSELSGPGRQAICYYEDDPSSFTPTKLNEFYSMLLEDGYYILSKFVIRPEGRQRLAPAPPIERDVIYLAENQIPFFILEKIGEMIGLSSTTVVDEFCSYIEELLKSHGYAIGKRRSGTPDPSNLLHLLHILLIGYDPSPTVQTTGQDAPAIEMVVQVRTEAEVSHAANSGHSPPTTPVAAVPNPSATEQSGGRPIRPFRRWRRAKLYDMARVDLTGIDLISIINGLGGETCQERSILDVKRIRRRCGIGLEFPSLYVDSETWCMLRNLIVLEQQNAEKLQNRVTAYCVLMSQLACTKEDVELLARRRVTDHYMPDDDSCARKFADLCTGVTFDLDDLTLNYLRDNCVELDRHYRSRPSKWTAWMLREYCRNPCVAVGSVIAIIFIAFAVLQAVYTVLKLARKVK